MPGGQIGKRHRPAQRHHHREFCVSDCDLLTGVMIRPASPALKVQRFRLRQPDGPGDSVGMISIGSSSFEGWVAWPASRSPTPSRTSELCVPFLRQRVRLRGGSAESRVQQRWRNAVQQGQTTIIQFRAADPEASLSHPANQHQGLCLQRLRQPDQRHDSVQRHQHRNLCLPRWRQPGLDDFHR